MNGQPRRREGEYPPALWLEERKFLAARRGVQAEALGESPRDAVGVALSGGGIRSATFALGMFRGLAKHGCLKGIDYLSTVSGGGYFGAFYGRLWSRLTAPDREARRVGDVLLETDRPWILRNLRENGRYLAPNGSGDAFLAIAIALRNLLSLLVVVLLPLFTIALATCLARGWVGETVTAPLVRIAWGPSGAGFWSADTSPWWLLSAFLAHVGLAFGWAYWTLDNPFRNLLPPLAAVIGGVVLVHGTSLEPLGFHLIAVAGLTLLVVCVCWILSPMPPSTRAIPGDDAEAREVRRRLTGGMFGTGVLLVVSLGIAAVDHAGAYLAEHGAGEARAWLAGLLTTGIGIATFGKSLAVLVGGKAPGLRIRPGVSLLAGIAGVVAIAVVLVSLFFLAHLTHRAGGDGPGAKWALAAGLGLSLVSGLNWPFLNRSSFHGLYAERLARAYLGASNARRKREPEATRLMPDDDVGMDRYWGPPDTAPSTETARKRSWRRATRDPMEAAQDGRMPPPLVGGPLHLVNITFNETFGGRSNLEMRDHKGLAFVVGPGGLTAGVHHHWVRDWSRPDAPGTRLPSAEGEYAIFGPASRSKVSERLPLGYWMGISGAAFSTGLGARTSLGLSILCGLANVRLGYWWLSGAVPSDPREARRPILRAWRWAWRIVRRWVFPVQWHLVAYEMLARFPGPRRTNWYLTDGGHFENTGAYELVRRRLSRILVVDASEDARYAFADLGNLVRKARIDFGAEITFLDAEALDAAVASSHRGLFGPLDDLARGGEPGAPDEARVRQARSKAHAALARIDYGEGVDPGWLLYVKPTVTGGEPADVTQYQSVHPEFPHETTADQFFDEAQWESYRRLGQSIGEGLFGPGTPSGGAPPRPGSFFPPLWKPADLLDPTRPLPGT